MIRISDYRPSRDKMCWGLLSVGLELLWLILFSSCFYNNFTSISKLICVLQILAGFVCNFRFGVRGLSGFENVIIWLCPPAVLFMPRSCYGLELYLRHLETLTRRVHIFFYFFFFCQECGNKNFPCARGLTLRITLGTCKYLVRTARV